MPKKRKKSAPTSDIVQAVKAIYSGGIVSSDALYDEESYYDGIRDDVRRALHTIKGVDLLYDRPPEARPHWEEGDDPDEDPPSWTEEPASYDLHFVALQGEEYLFEGEMDEDAFNEELQDVETVTLPTVGRIGCAVGVSIVGPYAVIRFTEMEFTETGSHTQPDIEVRVFDLDGTELDLEEHYKELFLEEGIQALRSLREEITQKLAPFGIRVLSDAELKKHVPGLKLDPEILQSDPAFFPFKQKKGVTVEDALFFRML
ncbi:MAG: hypothetical protein HYZ00_00230 [Candidatus Hydrogenedentes bacterium]|nr:hypothetical protein [Candidatus Hydrogenedentota bacterium]